MTILQEVQSLILQQPEQNLEAIAVLLRAMSSQKTQQIPNGNIIGALKGQYMLPPDFIEQSKKLDEEIAREFYGE